MRLRCPNTNCQKVLEIPDELAGKPVKCPGCGSQFSAPSSTYEPWKSVGQQEVTTVPTFVQDAPTKETGSLTDLPEATLIMPAAKKADDPMIGLVLGGCRLQSKLGQGGMGAVYRARHEGLDIDVAVKVLPRFLAEQRPDFIERFQREARVAARLDHPNVVRVHNVGAEQGQHYLVMEFVEGESLKNRLEQKKCLEVQEAIDITKQVLLALDAAHEKGIIHRDIKPDNILLKAAKEESGRREGFRDRSGGGHRMSVVAKLADLGLAKIASLTDANSMRGGNTVSGVMMGTVDYMAPEQADDAKRVDTRADIYSLGCTLFQMLSGNKPYTAETPIQLVLKHMSADIPDIRVARPEVPPDLGAMVRKMLAKNPTDRYQSAAEALEVLDQIELGPSGEKESPSTPASVAAGSPPPASASAVEELKEGICPSPSCRRPNRLEAKWCAFCGTSMVEKCPKCGGEVRVGGAFCIHCGSNLLEEREVTQALEKVRGFLQSKQPKNALAEIEAVLSHFPGRAEALELKGQVESSVGRLSGLLEMAAKAEEAQEYEAAQQHLQQALDLSAGDENIQVKLQAFPDLIRQRDTHRRLSEAQSLRDARQPRRALEMYEEILSAQPEQPQAVSGRKVCERTLKRVSGLQKQLQETGEKGDLQKALEVCHSILELDVEDSDANGVAADLEKKMSQATQAMEQARRSEQEKKWDAAIEAWKLAQATWPSSPEAERGLRAAVQARDQWLSYIEQARRCMQEKQLAQAEEALSRALQLGEWPEGQQWLVQVRTELGQAGKLIQDARLASGKKDWQAAIELWKAVIEVWPTHSEAKECLDEAKRACEKFGRFRDMAGSLAADRNLTLAEEMLVAALDAGNWPEGQELLQQVRADVARLEELVRQARDFNQKKDWEKSIAAWQEALALSPNHPEAQEGLESASRSRDELARLVARAEALAQGRDLEEAEDALSRALKAGHWPQGEQLHRQIREKRQAAEQRLAQAWQLFEAKNWEQATEAFQKVLQAWPSHAGARQGLENTKAADAAFRLAVEKASRLVSARSLAEAEQSLVKALQAGAWPEGSGLLQKVQADIARLKQWMEQAQRLSQEQKWAEAQDLLKQAAQVWPSHPALHELQERVAEGDRSFRQGVEEAQRLLEQRKLKPAIAALEQALRIGHWPEGAERLQKARDQEAAGRELARKGEEAAGKWLWRPAYKLFLDARTLDEDTVPAEQMEKIAGLARQMEQQIDWLRKWNKEGRFQDVMAEAAKVAKIGSDPELDTLRQAASEKFDQLRRMEAKAEQFEAEVNPKAAIELLEHIQGLQPFRKDVQTRLQKLRSQYQSAQGRLEEGLRWAGQKKWEQALASAREALTTNQQFPEAQELAQKAQDKIREEVRRRKLLIAAGVSAAVLVLGVSLAVFQVRRSQQAAQKKVDFDARMAAAETSNREGAVKAEAGLWEEARGFYTESEQAYDQAEKIAGSASLAEQRRLARDRRDETARVLKVIPTLAQKMAEAEAHRKASSWLDARTAFDRALELAGQANLTETLLKKIQSSRNEMDYLDSMQAAEQQVSAKRWKEAGESYTKAKRLAIEGFLGDEQQKKAEEGFEKIKFQVAMSQFEEKMAEGERLEAEQSWETAQAAFKEAAGIARQTPLDAALLARAEMKEQMAREGVATAIFEKVMKEGANLFVEDNWEKAAEAFGRAEELAAQKGLPEKRIAEARQKREKASQLHQAFTSYQARIRQATELSEAQKWDEADQSFGEAETLARQKQLPEKYAKEAQEKGQASRRKKVERNYGDLFKSGLEHEKAGQWTEAAAAFNSALRVARESNLGDPLVSDAQTRLETVQQIESAQSNFQEQIEKGNRLLAAKNYEEAVRAFEQAVSSALKEHLDPDRVKEANEKLRQARGGNALVRYEEAMKRGAQSLAARHWEDARLAYSEAHKVAVESPLDEASQKEAQDRLGSIGKEVSRAQVEEKLREGDSLEGKEDWTRALEALAAAVAVARESGLQDLIAATEQKEREARTRWYAWRVKNAVRGGDTALAAQDWAASIAAYQEAEKLAREGQLPAEAADPITLKLQRAEELRSGTEAYAAALRTGDEHAAARRWKEAKERYEAALQVAREKNLGTPRVQEVEAKAQNALQMDIAVGDFRRQMQDGGEHLKQGRLADARQAYTEAERIARQLLKEDDKAGEAKTLVAKVFRLEFQEKMDRGKQHAKEQKWKEAIESYREAESVGLRAALDKAEVQNALTERANAEKMEDASRRFSEKLASAEEKEKKEEWVEARKLYLDAFQIAKDTPLTEQQVAYTHKKLEETRKKVPVELVYKKPDFDRDEAKRRQLETSQALGVPERFDLDLDKNVKMTFILIPAGEFYMGSDKGDSGRDKDEGGADGGKVRIRITKPYYLGKTEVTQGQWYALMKHNPCKYKEGDDNPVESVSWNDCQEFIGKLNEKLKQSGSQDKCRLPTEAEWEAACRAGSAKQYWFGDRTASVKLMDPYMWFSFNSDKGTRPDEIFNPEEPIKKTGRRDAKHHPVATKEQQDKKDPKKDRRHPFGLHDVHGNVFEWCLDWYDKDYFSLVRPEDPCLENVAKPKERSIRGGAAGCNLWWCRSAEREGEDPTVGHPDVGFRVLVETATAAGETHE
ncbi:MAG: SUMF1/EgtB/PvdO family nonheme iron enzyme [Planctomycetes bacterium]|nr:SUMF1/EgtB/PvdO family nonheme iron enzyme [Planctomycetota bacterium]